MGKHNERKVELNRDNDSLMFHVDDVRYNGSEVKVEVAYWRLLRNGNSEEVRIFAWLTPDDLNCVRGQIRRGIEESISKKRADADDDEERLNAS